MRVKVFERLLQLRKLTQCQLCGADQNDGQQKGCKSITRGIFGERLVAAVLGEADRLAGLRVDLIPGRGGNPAGVHIAKRQIHHVASLDGSRDPCLGVRREIKGVQKGKIVGPDVTKRNVLSLRRLEHARGADRRRLAAGNAGRQDHGFEQRFLRALERS